MEYIDGGRSHDQESVDSFHFARAFVAKLFSQLILDSADCRRHFVKIL